MPKFYHSVSAAQATGNKPCNVRVGGSSKFPASIRGKVVAGRAQWYGYQGIVTNEAGVEVWRGPMREAPGQPGTVTLAGVTHNGDAMPPVGKSDAEAIAQASADALARAKHLGDAVLASAFKASTSSGKKLVVAKYKGEWMLQDHAFVLQGPDGKQYAWIVSREIPAMSYGVQGGDDDDAVAGPATWLSDAQISVGVSAASTKAALRLEPTLNAPGFSHPFPSGDSQWASLTVRPTRVIDAQFESLGTRPIKPSTGARLGSMALRALDVSLDHPHLVGFVVLGTYKVGRWAAHEYMAHRAAKKAAAIASATSSASSSTAPAAAAKPKRPPMPGWPAINFRGGKKAKAAKKAGTLTEPYTLSIEVEKNHKASFDMKDGSVDELKCMAVTAVVRDTDGDLVWSTSQLHVPAERQKELLIPASVQVVAYVSTLLSEAEAYIGFIEAEPDMEVTVKTFVEACPHCGGACIDGACPTCSSEPALLGPPDMAQASTRRNFNFKLFES